jgi:hypothetical protein
VQVTSQVIVTWTAIDPYQHMSLHPGEAWSGPQWYLNFVGTSLPPNLTATIDWGDGSNKTVFSPSNANLVHINGSSLLPIARSHIYANEGTFTASITLNAPGHAVVSSREQVTARRPDPTPQFRFEPSTPTIGNVAFAIPAPPNPSGRPILEYRWDFGNGTKLVDNAFFQKSFASLAREYSKPVPILDGQLSALHLSPTQDSSQWDLYKKLIPQHQIPVVFTKAQGYGVTLTEVDTAKVPVPASVTHIISTTNICNVWAGGYIPVLSNYTTCETVTGFETVTKIPDRRPDYYAFQISLPTSSPRLGGAATITITNDGSVYASLSGSVGVGVSVDTALVGVGYLGDPTGANIPSDKAIDDYVNGLSISTGLNAELLGRGYAMTLVLNPGGPNGTSLGGEEYWVGSSANKVGLSASLGVSCSVGLDTIASVAAIIPPPTASKWAINGGSIPQLTAQMKRDILASSSFGFNALTTCVPGKY